MKVGQIRARVSSLKVVLVVAAHAVAAGVVLVVVLVVSYCSAPSK